VMLHLRRLGLLHREVLTTSGESLDTVLDWWEQSERRQAARTRLHQLDGVDPDQVIYSPQAARQAGLTSTVIFPTGNLAPHGSVVKATAIDPSVVGPEQVYRLRGPAKVFTTEQAAIQAIKGQGDRPMHAGEVLVYIGGGPLGTGMEEIYEITAALKHLPWGKHVPVLTDARFSGVSTGACIGHIAPEALAGGPLGKLRDGDVVEIEIDRTNLVGRINLVGVGEQELDQPAAATELAERSLHPDLKPRPDLPDDTRLWAALQEASGGIWAGAIYDVDRIIALLEAGIKASS